MARESPKAPRIPDWYHAAEHLYECARAVHGPEDPRRVLASNVSHFRRNAPHMRCSEYRGRGWPVGSGNVESGIKQFNKRVKGTEQFWQPPGAEAILCLRGLWLDQDHRWRRYWNSRPAHKRAA